MAVCCARAGAVGPSGNDGVDMPSEWSNDELSSEGSPEPSSELRELEDELCRLAGILAVRIVGDRFERGEVLPRPDPPA